ncbi:MAG: cation transporter [Alphaproteobacteria bacterium]|jgi:cobalt-zinc-cadmium efflux system protein|nr:cation transporter [Reyranella sp.]MBL6940069.1 cation transporter [Alphaproteobacteria bacterium]MBL7100156.1 cation transporter [Alphaproteobacteria bacterium]
MSHAHDHGSEPAGHSHGHTHAPPKDFSAAFKIGIGLSLTIVVLQAVFGYVANSMALMADAGHNLSDVLSLVVAWGAANLARRPATERYTYGLRGSSIIAALFNAVFLLVVMGGISWEAIRRFYEPAVVEGRIVMAVAAAGIVISGFSAYLFASGRDRDLNLRGAFLHMLSDALVSVGVVVAGGLIALTGWHWLDPAVTLVIVAVIVYGTWGLLRESVGMALAGVPAGIDAGKVATYLSGLPGVSRIHDLHIWPMSTTEVALTCHLVMPGGHPGDGFTMDAAKALHDTFAIEHTTLQIELSEDADCALEQGHATPA